ncbi:C45 family peptidase [Bacillus sp. FJAT-29953]|nr:C45 family peptidase [Bacillus sp. FJAT-29953]
MKIILNLVIVGAILLIFGSDHSVLAACTIMGATGTATLGRRVFLASTSDNPYLEGPRKPVVVTIPKDGGYKFVHTPCLIKDPSGELVDIGSDRGMNETGFSWTRAWVVPKEGENPEKLDAVDWFLKMGATVPTVDAAITFVKENPKGFGTQGNYLFADRNGNMAVVEVGYKTVTVAETFTSKDLGIAARANRWETDPMVPLDDSKRGNTIHFDTSEFRYHRAMSLLKENASQIDVETMKKLISDRTPDPRAPHEKSISNHGLQSGTVSTEIYDPQNLTFWYTYGWPDGEVDNVDSAIFGENKNTWGRWIPFVLTELEEEGYYTDWAGNITPIGARYLGRKIGNIESALFFKK